MNEIGYILIGALAGAYFSSFFSWFHFKKQKRTEISIEEGKHLHKIISKIILDLNTLSPHYDQYIKDDSSLNRAYYIQQLIIPQSKTISSSLEDIVNIMNFANDFIDLDISKLKDIYNEWNETTQLMEDDYRKDEIFMKARQGQTVNMIDELSYMDIKLRYNAYNPLYGFWEKSRKALNLFKFKRLKDKASGVQ